MTELRTYILQRGKHQYRDTNGEMQIAKAGDPIRLNADQAKAFKDRIKATAVVEAEAAIAKAAEGAANDDNAGTDKGGATKPTSPTTPPTTNASSGNAGGK